MFQDEGNGFIHIQGLNCYLPQSPPDEEVANFYLPKEQQKWRRTPLPAEWKQWRIEEAKMQKTDPDYCHPFIEDFKLQEWTRRLKGYWFFNNGVKTYITGLHYMYLNWWKIDIGYPAYRYSDLTYFYFLQYCIEDPDCLGMVDVARRRSGKTFKAGLFLYDYISRSKNAHGGIQSKTDADAKQVFSKAVVSPFKHLPDFFRPNFDTSGGNTPKKELRFYAASKRGKNALEFDDDDELESYIDFAASGEFAYDGSKLQRYVCDESGKVLSIDVSKRHQVTKFCSMEGSDIIGKQLFTTTVEEMEKGGKGFKDIWDKSDHSKRNENNRTVSGLYRYITLAHESLYYDDFGNPLIDKANDWIDAELRGMGNDANEKASFKRKYPRSVKEAFYVDGKDCIFNAGILNDRLSYLQTRPQGVYGDFEWKDGKVDGEVVWVPNDYSKKWLVYGLPTLEEQNCISTVYSHDYQRNLFTPMNDHKFRIGIDPIDHAKTTKSESKASNAAIWVFRQFDPNIDDHTQVDQLGRPLDIIDDFGKITSAWKTYNFWAEYLHRPDEPLDFYEDVIKAMRFFGCKVLIENQKPGLINHLRQRGYSHFIMSRPEETFTTSHNKGLNQDTSGMPSSKVMIDHYLGKLKTFITFHGHRVPSMNFIEQCLDFTPEKIRDFDSVVAAGYTLVASEATVIPVKHEVQLSNFFKKYNKGRRVR